MVETSLLRKIWKVAFLLGLPITLRLKSLEKLLGTYFPFYTVMEKFNIFPHVLRLILQKCEKIKDDIVRSKLKERKVGRRGCDSSKCQDCKSISIIEEFTSVITKKNL